MSIYKLSPSDLTFAWDECRYCFYMKVKHNVVLRTPFPGMFGKMANLTSDYYHDKPAREIDPSLPAGMVKFREKFVRSAPISVPGAVSQCYISGRFDAVIEFEDGSYGIVDYKTSEAKDEHVAFYSRQLTAYAYALEHPAENALSLTPVSRMGLFVVTPHQYKRTPAGEVIYVNKTTWMEIPREDQVFLAFLGEVLAVLDAPHPPPSSQDCGVCQYREHMREFTG